MNKKLKELTETLYKHINPDEDLKLFIKITAQIIWEDGYKRGQNDAIAYTRALEQHRRNRE